LYVPAFDPPLDTADEAKCQELLSIQRGRAQRETPSLVQRRDTLLESMSFATTFSLTSAVKERMPVLYARVIKRAAEKDLDPAQPILRTMTKVEDDEADDGVEVETCRDDESTALLAETALLFTEIMVLIAAPGSSLLVVAPALCVQVAVDFFDIGGYSVFTEPFTH
jgi:hypothetical protein